MQGRVAEFLTLLEAGRVVTPQHTGQLLSGESILRVQAGRFLKFGYGSRLIDQAALANDDPQAQQRDRVRIGLQAPAQFLIEERVQGPAERPVSLRSLRAQKSSLFEQAQFPQRWPCPAVCRGRKETPCRQSRCCCRVRSGPPDRDRPVPAPGCPHGIRARRVVTKASADRDRRRIAWSQSARASVNRSRAM